MEVSIATLQILNMYAYLRAPKARAKFSDIIAKNKNWCPSPLLNIGALCAPLDFGAPQCPLKFVTRGARAPCAPPAHANALSNLLQIRMKA